MNKVNVAINGFGVIGKRVADAVRLQEDMELVGVADVSSDYRIQMAQQRGYSVFAATKESAIEMADAGISVAGDLHDLLAHSDIVVDCTPKHIGAKNRTRYKELGLKSVWHGGESHELAGFSFVAQLNYEDALNRDSARVVSCNTTALCRVLGALHQHDWVKRARVVLMRRATDPWESHLNGMINTVKPEVHIPSHQGPDAQHVIEDLNITTMAASGSHNLGHIHFAMIETTCAVSVDELRAVLAAAPRVAFVRAGQGVVALNSVAELMRDLGRPRGDMWEVAVWEDSLASDGTDLYITFQVHNEAIVVPETIDCIRALTGIERSGTTSIRKTDLALGVLPEFLPTPSN